MIYLMILVLLVIGAVVYMKTKNSKTATTPEPVVTPHAVEPTPTLVVTPPPATTTPPVVTPPVVTPAPTPVAPKPIIEPTPPNIPTDPGHGSWIPPSLPKRVVVDPGMSYVNEQGIPGRTVSYIPGCINSQSANFSSGGCAAFSRCKTTLTGTNVSKIVAFGSGKEIAIRFKPVQQVDPRYDGKTFGLALKGATGGNMTDGNFVNVVRMWMSPNPLATFEEVEDKWKNERTSTLKIIFGPGYCEIDKSVPFYYLMISYDAPEEYRFQLIDMPYLI